MFLQKKKIFLLGHMAFQILWMKGIKGILFQVKRRK